MAKAYSRTNDKLTWRSLDPEQHERTCGYWYLVKQDNYAHTAFRTREAFLAWAALYNLTVDADAVPLAGTYAYGRISGQYRRTAHIGVARNTHVAGDYVGGYDEFFALEGDRIRLTDNGEITLGIVTTDADGIRNVHHLNCNMRDRPKFERSGVQVF